MNELFTIDHAPKTNHILLFVFDFLSVCGVLRYVFPLFHGLFETPDGFADGTSHFWKLAGTKDNQSDNEDNDQVHRLKETLHFLSTSYFLFSCCLIVL